MNEIMPYYNQLYKSTLLEFNPLWTDDYTREGGKSNDGTSLNVSERDNSQLSNGTDKAENVSRDKYSDTPQGSLQNIENDTYLTNARKVTDDNKTERTNISQSNDKEQNQNVFNNTEDYLESVQGRRGKDASELLMKYRKTFLNIDMEIIDELEELFIHLW